MVGSKNQNLILKSGTEATIPLKLSFCDYLKHLFSVIGFAYILFNRVSIFWHGRVKNTLLILKTWNGRSEKKNWVTKKKIIFSNRKTPRLAVCFLRMILAWSTRATDAHSRHGVERTLTGLLSDPVFEIIFVKWMCVRVALTPG